MRSRSVCDSGDGTSARGPTRIRCATVVVLLEVLLASTASMSDVLVSTATSATHAAGVFASPALAVKAGRKRGPTVLERRRKEECEQLAEIEASAAKRRRTGPEQVRAERQCCTSSQSRLQNGAKKGNQCGVNNCGRGRVRLHAVQVQSACALDGEDERRKCLGEKGWARRSVVVHGVSASGAANLEDVPGREDFPAGADGDAEWEASALQFEDENFEDAGAEVRSMDVRDRKVGLFGDFLERVGHGKFAEWRSNEEQGGLYELKVVKSYGKSP